MRLDQLIKLKKSRKKRLGRGIGSGKGKTAANFFVRNSGEVIQFLKLTAST